jgi:hypothetical protein
MFVIFRSIELRIQTIDAHPIDLTAGEVLTAANQHTALALYGFDTAQRVLDTKR